MNGRTLLSVMSLVIFGVLGLTVMIGYFTMSRLPAVLGTASVVACLTEDCAGGAVWTAMVYGANGCDFRQFATDLQRQFDRGRHLTLTCSGDNGMAAQQKIWCGDFNACDRNQLIGGDAGNTHGF